MDSERALGAESGASLDLPDLTLAAGPRLDPSPDRAPIRRRALEVDLDPMVAVGEIVPEQQVRMAHVAADVQIEITVAVEVAIGDAGLVVGAEQRIGGDIGEDVPAV